MSQQQISPAIHAVPNVDSLEHKFLNAEANIAVVGLGYVGLPLVAALYNQGFNTVGFDVDKKRVNNLNKGQSPIKHIEGRDIQKMIDDDKFIATHDFEKLSQADAVIICVPTPLTKQREPDLSYVLETTRTIAKYLKPGQLITLESTTYPGTTTEVMKPLIEAQTGMISGTHFFLAYSPEREDPGNAGFSAQNTPKVVGGDGDNAMRLAKALYGKIIETVVPVSSPETAEAVKLTENIFRAVNIALVNELKVIYAEMDIDIWEVIDAAKTKPFGFMPFYPGPGLGGHCIPIDPFYLTWKAREFEVNTRFIELAGEINVSMIKYVTNNLAEALNEHAQKSLSGSKILLLGVAYKRDVDDMRESPSLRIWELLESKGAEVDYHDPFLPRIPKTREHMSLRDRESISLSAETIKNYDAVFVATDHSNVDYKLIADNSPLIIDSRNVFERNNIKAPHIIKT